ncbi:hypothetical protein I315_06327 [Cryptococcus gattii Ru294]|nr:hypothetical protein I315_06327 [Cryptococcus gattii Ru294]
MVSITSFSAGAATLPSSITSICRKPSKPVAVGHVSSIRQDETVQWVIISTDGISTTFVHSSTQSPATPRTPTIKWLLLAPVPSSLLKHS